MKECCKIYLNDQFGGDEAVTSEIYGEYVRSSGEKLAEIVDAIGRSDWSTVDKAAHAIKGIALAVGDEPVAGLAIDLRTASRLSDSDEANRLVQRLEKELAAL